MEKIRFGTEHISRLSSKRQAIETSGTSTQPEHHEQLSRRHRDEGFTMAKDANCDLTALLVQRY